MLFDPNIEPSCSYCQFGVLIGNGEVACEKRGITSAFGSCRKYRYDPIMREPERPTAIERDEYTEEDFQL